MRIYFRYTKHLLVNLSIIASLIGITLFSLWRLKMWRQEIESEVSKVKVRRNFSIPELMGSTNVVEVVQPDVSTLLHQPSMPFLKRTRTHKRPFAVVVVTSQARFFNQRYSIRSTWYKWADELNIRVFFMIGFHDPRKQELFKILENEHQLFDDLIIDSYEEGYYKLPGKILRMLKWYNSTYSTENAPRFFIKTDQDVFLQLPNIVKALKSTPYYQNLASFSHCKNHDNSSSCIIPDQVNLPMDPSDPETYYIGGRKFENPHIDSDPDSKWYIDSSEREKMNWPSSFYPTYTNGPCYVISGNAVNSIYQTSFKVPIYPFEDVYIVGMIAHDRLNMYISNLPEMWLDGTSFSKLKNKHKLKKMLALHPVDQPTFMLKVCKKFNSCRQHLNSTSSAVNNRSFSISYTLALGLLSISNFQKLLTKCYYFVIK